MRKRREIRPHGQLIPASFVSLFTAPGSRCCNLHGPIRDIIRCIHANHRRQNRPRAERAAAERGDVFGRDGWGVDGRRVVDARGEFEGCVGLHGVANGDYRGLCVFVRYGL
jgi:hypothetical protein